MMFARVRKAYVLESQVTHEVPAGDINGANRTFATSTKFVQGSLAVYWNGLHQTAGADSDYEEQPAAQGFVMAVAPPTGDQLVVAYTRDVLAGA